jgi:microcystin-dependent protein
MATPARRKGSGLGPPQEGRVEQLRQNIQREIDELRAASDSATTALAAAMPTGVVVPYAGAVAPSGWLLCDGAAVSRFAFQALFAIIGVMYGAGDGATTFNIPDMRDRSPMGANSTVALAATAGALTTTHSHADGTLAVASHSHGVGTFGVDSHSHSDGTLAVASHSHSDGTLAVASHSHSADGTLAVASHTHGAGTYVTASHVHALDDNGYARITIDDAGGDVFGRFVTGVTAWSSTREAYGAAGAQLTGITSGAALRGDTALSGTVDVSGDSGSTAPDVTGNTSSEAPDVTGSTGSTAPDVTGSTGSSTATISGTSESVAPDVTGATANDDTAILHPVIGLNYIIRI